MTKPACRGSCISGTEIWTLECLEVVLGAGVVGYCHPLVPGLTEQSDRISVQVAISIGDSRGTSRDERL